MALRGEQHPIHRPRARHRLLPDLQTISRMPRPLWYSNGRALRQCSSHCSRRLSRSGSRSDIWHVATRLCVRISSRHSLRSWSSQYDVSRLAPFVLVWSLPSSPDNHLPSMPTRDQSVQRPSRCPPSQRQSHQHLPRRRPGCAQKALDPLILPCPPNGWLQLHVPRLPGLIPSNVAKSI